MHNVRPLLIGNVPSNIRLPEGSRATHVEHDLHNIAERLHEIDPEAGYGLNLIEHVDGETMWAVCERDRSGRECLIFRVGPGCEIDTLDARVISKVQYLRSVPLQERLERIERDLEVAAEKRVEEQKEKMYEKLGAPMYANLARLGFIDTPRTESLRPQNATARRAGRREK